MKCVGLLHKLNMLLPGQSLLTIYKSLTRAHLDYGFVVYSQPVNESHSNRIEPVQQSLEPYKGEKLYQELGLGHLHQRWWMRQLYLFYNVFHNKIPKYVHSLLPSIRTSARQPNIFISFYCSAEYFQNFFTVRHKGMEQTDHSSWY